MNISLRTIFIFLSLFILSSTAASSETLWPKTAFSEDNTAISYEVYGMGEPVLVFVHGWNCDLRYWRAQVPFFSGKYKTVFIDLAGHGNSASSRSDYTMKSFGRDVKAVCDAINAKNIILIGHSMGGHVIAQAALIMPERVKGLIGVDTLENIEYPLTKEEYQKMRLPLEKDFRSGCENFVSQMLIHKKTDLSRWILSDMCSADKTNSLSAMKSMMTNYITGDAAKTFDKIKKPVVTVNASLWPVNHEANNRHMQFFRSIKIEDSDHFLMMNRPDKFNKALDDAIKIVIKKGM